MPESSRAKPNIIFIHGLMGSGQGFKATRLRERYPWILTPDFEGDLHERIDALEKLLGDSEGWRMVGSSFGGLMAAMYAARHPERVERLVLLAPALVWPDFAASPPDPIDVPGAVYQGRQDELLPFESVRELAEKVFPNLIFHLVEDDHGLHDTVRNLDWDAVLDL